MKKALLVLIMFCLTLNFTLAFSISKAEAKSPEVDLLVISTRILQHEINDAICKRYGTDWIFNPKKVCAVKGNVSIEGVLHQKNEIKNLKINFQKQNTKYKMMEISEG
ncbi:hypothetical protein JI735_33765 (plasmid) [Paenibacillus sonchi]|uniref:Uncharacterized protein n=1 Tax=Paenibacillus sonchi TaxID=373687 RepID=A0A974PIM2_9BACL|nr:hypothetical protein [Paenibacillus sonchi]QQZ64620.1 hypothetical protein JI735_33765 [Paenibacillus sonchi]